MEQLGGEDPQATQRLIWATLALAVIFGIWAFFVRPKQAQPPPAKPMPQQSAALPSQPATKPPAEARPPESVAPPPAATQPVQAQEETALTLKNDDLWVEVSNRGAVLRRVVLQKYGQKGGEKDDLVSPLAQLSRTYPLAVATGDKAFDDLVNGALFHVEQLDRTGGGSTVRLSWADGTGDAVTKSFGLPPSGFEMEFSVSVSKAGEPLSPVPISWGPGFGQLLASQAKSRYYQQEYVGLFEAGAFKKIQRSRVKADKPELTDAYGAGGPIAWAAITNSYFAALFKPDSPMPWARIVTRTLTPEEMKVHAAEADITLLVGYPGSGRLFMGPKVYEGFKGMGDGYHRLLDWGSSDFGNTVLEPICAILLWGLKRLYAFSHNYGLAIILLTFIIKLGFFPLTQRSMVKMKEMGEAMKKLKPQIERIKLKYKKMGKSMETRSKMNEETMALYQREGINPLGGMSGCLPMILQMPIFIALFQLLPRAMDLRGAPFFGWIRDLSIPDPYYVTPLLMGISMVVSTKMTSTQGMEGAQKMMLWFMPVMFTWFCLWAPAGLTLYWFTNNLLTMGQQALINRQVAQRQEAAAKQRKSTPKGPSKPS